MAFINPKIDFAFKKIFGSDQSQPILISFLNAILYDGRSIIQSVIILDPYLAPKIRGIKDTFVDVKATLLTEDHQTSEVIIEMQVLNVEGFEKRILYNAAKAYSTQLATGEDYLSLQPVIALTITDFVMFEEIEAIVSRFTLKERTYLVDYQIYDIELVFVELPKFQKRLEELADIQDKWLFFLGSAPRLKQVPEIIKEPELQQAFRIAEQSNLTKEELDDFEKRAIFIHDQRNATLKAERLGREKGIAEGLQEGLQQGLQEGLQQGLQEGLQQGLQEGQMQAKREVALRLINTMPDSEVERITGLSRAEIQELKLPSAE